jgi:hypothetical protein
VCSHFQSCFCKFQPEGKEILRGDWRRGQSVVLYIQHLVEDLTILISVTLINTGLVCRVDSGSLRVRNKMQQRRVACLVCL